MPSFICFFVGYTYLSLEKDMFSKLDLKWTWNGMPQFYNSQTLLQKLKAFLMLMDSVAIDIVGGNSKSSEKPAKVWDMIPGTSTWS